MRGLVEDFKEMSVLDRICDFPYQRESGLMVPGRKGNVMQRQRWKDSGRGGVGGPCTEVCYETLKS